MKHLKNRHIHIKKMGGGLKKYLHIKKMGGGLKKHLDMQKPRGLEHNYMHDAQVDGSRLREMAHDHSQPHHHHEELRNDIGGRLEKLKFGDKKRKGIKLTI